MNTLVTQWRRNSINYLTLKHSVYNMVTRDEIAVLYTLYYCRLTVLHQIYFEIRKILTRDCIGYFLKKIADEILSYGEINGFCLLVACICTEHWNDCVWCLAEEMAADAV